MSTNMDNHKIQEDISLDKITNDSAFRVIMVLETSNYLNRLEANQFTIFTQKFHNSVSKSVKRFKGNIVKKDNNSYIISFKSVTDAVFCALKIQFKFKYVTPKFDASIRKLKIGLTSGYPDNKNNLLYEKVTTIATTICEVVKEQLVISSEINTLYTLENKNSILDTSLVRMLKPAEENFLTQLMNIVDKLLKKKNFSTADLTKKLGYSRSQIYRKLKKLTGKSPNIFIRDIKLQKALKLLHNREGNISEIATKTGFNSPTYFSKCFKDKYGILPSKYIQQHII